MHSGPAAAVEELHVHTDASDGALGAAAVVELARRRGVGVLAITDHDTMAAVPEAMRAGRRLGVRVVPGVELSARGPAGPLHLLAYFEDPAPRALLERLEGLVEERRARAAAIVARLAELGVRLSAEAVAARARVAVGRPHIAAAIVAAGAAADPREAFERYLADGAPAYVPAPGLEDEEALRLVAAAGGAASLAHPWTLRAAPAALAAQAARLAAAGLGGIEVHRPDHGPRERSEYGALAARLGLVATGGSDFHGLCGRVAPGDTGEPPLPAGALDRLLARRPSATVRRP